MRMHDPINQNRLQKVPAREEELGIAAELGKPTLDGCVEVGDARVSDLVVAKVKLLERLEVVLAEVGHQRGHAGPRRDRGCMQFATGAAPRRKHQMI